MRRILKYFDTKQAFGLKYIADDDSNTSYTVNGLSVYGTPEILWDDICFIESTKEVWTHGSYWATGGAEYTAGEHIAISNDNVVSAYGFITEHQDLSSYATVSYVTTEVGKKQDTLTAGEHVAISNDNTVSAYGFITEHQDLSSYATISYVETAVSNVYTTGAMADQDLYAWYTDDWSERWAKMTSCTWQKNGDYIIVSAMGVKTIANWAAIFYSLPTAPAAGQTASGVVPVNGSSADVISWTLTTQTTQQGQVLDVLCLNKLYGGNFSANGSADIVFVYKYK